jgi:hypothetical protein
MPKICIGGKTAFSTNGVGKTGYLHVEELKLNPYLSPSTKINSKCIKDINIRPETLNCCRQTFEDIGILSQLSEQDSNRSGNKCKN